MLWKFSHVTLNWNILPINIYYIVDSCSYISLTLFWSIPYVNRQHTGTSSGLTWSLTSIMSRRMEGDSSPVKYDFGTFYDPNMCGYPSYWWIDSRRASTFSHAFSLPKSVRYLSFSTTHLLSRSINVRQLSGLWFHVVFLTFQRALWSRGGPVRKISKFTRTLLPQVDQWYFFPYKEVWEESRGVSFKNNWKPAYKGPHRKKPRGY